MTYQILQGDAKHLPLADAVFDSCVTDPPYELGFMGKAWDRSGIAYSVDVWREVYRVLKPGAHLLAFGGTRTYHRMACAIEDAGFEIRDQMQWIYGSGFPKSRDLGQGRGTALKPANEPICLARKPLEKGLTVAQNILMWRTGALNIDLCRIPANGDKLDGGRVSTTTEGWDRPWKHDADAIAACKERGADAVARAEDLGRWPANVIHDGSEEVLAGFPQSLGQQGAVRGTEPSECHNGVYSGPRKREGLLYEPRGDSGSAARFFYCAKASGNDRGDNNHPTVKPTDLMQYLCRLITPPGGLILDPFVGSGSTIKAALIEHFRCVGIDINLEYLPIVKQRLLNVQVKLF